MAATASPGSVWSASARLSDLARDLRASQVNDLITILVVERASAVAKGSTKSARASSASNSISALAGLTRATGPLANLANLSGDTQLSGEGSTSRETVLNTTLSARVTEVLPNGAMVVEGTKTVQVNSEQQISHGARRGAAIGSEPRQRGPVRSAGAPGSADQRQGGRGGCHPAAVLPVPAVAGAAPVLRIIHATAHPAPGGLPGSGHDHGEGATRLKELAALEGVRDNQLIGYGLVVGLAGTGDRRQTVFSAQSLTNMLERMGVSVPPPPFA